MSARAQSSTIGSALAGMACRAMRCLRTTAYGDVDQSCVDTIRVCGHVGQGCVQGAVQTLPTAGQFDRPVGGTHRR